MSTDTLEDLRLPRAAAARVPVPVGHDAAIAAAAALAETLRPGAAHRDEARELPLSELEDLRATGLLTLPVPVADGGPGASHRTIATVFRIIAAADPAFAQIPQPHFSFVDTLARHGSEVQRRLLLGEVLRGARFGNALSERGGKHAFDFRTRLARRADGDHDLDGVKYYSTGALAADWVAVFALDDAGEPAVAYVPVGSAGLDVGQDWSAFGQRATLSGTTTLDGVRVRDIQVVRGIVEQGGAATTVGAYAQLLHSAIDVGIARGALQDGIRFTRDRARPWPAAGVARAVDEPAVQQVFGRLTTLVEASEEYLGRSADLMDVASADPTPENVAEARLGVGKAKAFAGEVVLEVTTGLFEAAGSSAVDERHALDRHWRNARTHTLHDPNRWKYIHAGRHVLLDVPPPVDDHSL